VSEARYTMYLCRVDVTCISSKNMIFEFLVLVMGLSGGIPLVNS